MRCLRDPRARQLAVFFVLAICGFLSLATSPCDSAVTRSLTRELDFIQGQNSVMRRVQFDGDFVVLIVSGEATVLGPEGAPLPVAPFAGENFEPVYGSCEWAADELHQEGSGRDTVVCLQGAGDQRITVARSAVAPETRTLSAHVFADLGCSSSPEGYVLGVSVESVE